MGEYVFPAAVQTGLTFLSGDINRRNTNKAIDTQMNWANTQAERNRGWAQSDIAAQNAFNTGLLDRSIAYQNDLWNKQVGFQEGLIGRQRDWQLEDRDWLVNQMGGMQEGLQSRIMAENARLAEQARQQYLQDVSHYENFWKQNAYPSDEKINAARAANQASLNQTREGAERRFFDDASSRGLRGGALGAGMQNIETDYSNRYKEMVNALTQFKNTPQWTPASTLAGYQNMPQANAVPFPSLSMGSYPSMSMPTAGNVNFGIAAQNQLPNYSTSSIGVPSYSNIANDLSGLGSMYMGQYAQNNRYDKLIDAINSKNTYNPYPDQFRY
jgi:hypothetical protein